MNRFRKHTPLLATGLLLSALAAQAQTTYTWDPDANFINDGGAGTWDLATTNWDDDGSTPNVLWSNGSNAIFGSGTYQVDLTSVDVTVGDLTYGGGGTLEFKGATASGSLADTIIIQSGGATWDTGGGEIEFFNDGNNSNTLLTMTSGDTLTVLGGGTFDTGQNPQTNANGSWQVSGATLDATAVATVIGNLRSIGQFGAVRLEAGNTFINERNASETFNNNWELTGTGNVIFDNRHTRPLKLTGVVSGTGGVTVQNRGGTANNGGFFELNNLANTFSGGVLVDASASAAMLIIRNGDGDLGAIPGTFDPDNITLKDGGAIKLVGVDLNANRGITLINGGVIDANTGPILNSGITGTGGLTIGYTGGTGATLTLNAISDYTGGTRIFKGPIALGIDEALPTALLTIGGNNGGNAKLILNEKTQTVTGLSSVNNNTRQIINQDNNDPIAGAAGEFIMDVPEGDERVYGAAYGVSSTANSGNFNTIKNGLGSQELRNVQVAGSITVNAGTLLLGGTSGVNGVQIGSASVTAATLNFNEDATIASTLFVDNGGSLGVSVDETDGSTTAEGLTFGHTGTTDLTLDYGALTANPTYPGINVTGLDLFSPSSSDITVNIEGTGFQIGQIELIKYNNTAPLADIVNFTIGTLPSGLIAVLVNNTANQSIDLDITGAIGSLTWSGDTTIDGIGNWDIETSSNWDINTATYTDFHVIGTGDNVTFDDSVLDIDTGVATVNLTTTLSPTSVTVNNSAAAAYVFSGTGSLSGSMALNKTGEGTLTISNTTGTNDYTGGTTITSGTILAGVDNALPVGGVVTIGGSGSSILEMNGNDLTIGGLEITGNNTRLVQNSAVTATTLTINVAGVEDYSYGANFGPVSSPGPIDIVKGGTGTQRITKDGFNNVPQSLTVNNGLLVWDTLGATVPTATVAGGTLQLGETFSPAPIGDVTVSSTGSLVLNGSTNAASLTAAPGSATSLNWSVGNWAGAAGTDWPQVAISGDLTINSGAASFTVVIDDSSISNFTEANASFTIATVGGTVTAATSDFTVDQTAFAAGSGTFALSVSGSDLVLDYTTAGAGPYDTWAGGALFDDDTNGDGVDNGLAFILGAADENADALALLPDGAATGGDLVMTFSIVNPIAPAVLSVEYTNDLTGLWTPVAVPTTAGTTTVGSVEFNVTGTDPLSVTATIDSSAASVGGELFGRLSATE